MEVVVVVFWGKWTSWPTYHHQPAHTRRQRQSSANRKNSNNNYHDGISAPPSHSNKGRKVSDSSNSGSVMGSGLGGSHGLPNMGGTRASGKWNMHGILCFFGGVCCAGQNGHNFQHDHHYHRPQPEENYNHQNIVPTAITTISPFFPLPRPLAPPPGTTTNTSGVTPTPTPSLKKGQRRKIIFIDG